MDWAKLKVTELKAELRSRGLPVNGLKSELVERLTSADAHHPQGSADPGLAEEGAPQTSPDTNGDTRAVDHPSAQPSANDDDNGEQMKAALETRENRTDDDAAREREDEAQPVPAPSPTPAAEGLSQPVAEEAPEIGFEPEPHDRAQDAPSAATAASMEDSAAAVASQDAHAPSAQKHAEEVVDVARDVQKRKRSPSPSPPDFGGRKRQRGNAEEDASEKPTAKPDEPQKGAREEDTAMENKPLVSSPDRTSREGAKPPPTEEPATSAPSAKTETLPQTAHPTAETRHFPGIEPSSHRAPEAAEAMDFERDIEPAIHPATPALYIRNFMRPLRAPDVQAHLAHLANPSDAETADGELETFFLDQIRTHAFAVFKSVSAASRVRTALHNRVWPDEANRRPLWVDFVPAEKVRGWIETEESQGGSRSSTAKRWVVVYDDSGSGDVARLELDEAPNRAPTGPSNRAPVPPPARPPPRGPAFNSTNTIPLGPRAQRGYEGPPSRPTVPSGRGHTREPGGKFGTTSGARPYVTFRLVSDELARQRLDDMRSYYTKDFHRDLGKEINRYTFEDGYRFVDRGVEVFEGIRPPHREREKQLERRGRGGGRGGARGGPRFGGRGPPPFHGSDRYLPGARDRDEWRRYDDSPPRHRGDRWEDDYHKDTGRLHFEDDRDVRGDYRNDRDGRY